MPVERVLDSWIRNGIATRSKSRTPLSNLLDSAWGELCEGYRCEYVYKNVLASRLIFHRHKPHTAAFLTEFVVGKSIADVVVVNGTTTAYELKTKYDSGRRLASQTSDYLRVFDRVFVVAHESLVSSVAPTLPGQVGLISMDDSGAMETLRTAESNAGGVLASSIFRCLRKSEYLSAVKAEVGAVPEVPNGILNATCAEVFSKLAASAAHAHFVRALKARTTDAETVRYVRALPVSMRAMGYATPLSMRERATLLSRVSASYPLRMTQG